MTSTEPQASGSPEAMEQARFNSLPAARDPTLKDIEYRIICFEQIVEIEAKMQSLSRDHIYRMERKINASFWAMISGALLALACLLKLLFA